MYVCMYVCMYVSFFLPFIKLFVYYYYLMIFPQTEPLSKSVPKTKPSPSGNSVGENITVLGASFSANVVVVNITDNDSGDAVIFLSSFEAAVLCNLKKKNKDGECDDKVKKEFNSIEVNITGCSVGSFSSVGVNFTVIIVGEANTDDMIFRVDKANKFAKESYKVRNYLDASMSSSSDDFVESLVTSFVAGGYLSLEEGLYVRVGMGWDNNGDDDNDAFVSDIVWTGFPDDYDYTPS